MQKEIECYHLNLIRIGEYSQQYLSCPAIVYDNHLFYIRYDYSINTQPMCVSYHLNEISYMNRTRIKDLNEKINGKTYKEHIEEIFNSDEFKSFNFENMLTII